MRKYQKKQNFYICIAGLIAIVILLFTLGFFYKHNQYGNLQINTLDENLSIFIDNKKETAEQAINPNFKLKNGIHTVIISKEGYWPWIKNTDIAKKQTIEITPFFIPKNTSGFLIGEKDPEYTSILSLFQKNTLVAEAYSRIANDTDLKSKTEAIDFYKNRTDVVIIALANGVFALGIEDDNIQNLQPIYKGKNPVFVKKDDNSIYILDDGNLLLVNY